MQIKTCSDGEHRFKTMQVKGLEAGPPYTFFSSCRKCPVILEQTVTMKGDARGNLFPVASAHLIAADVEPIDNAAAEAQR